jgi:hypothetical protein
LRKETHPRIKGPVGQKSQKNLLGLILCSGAPLDVGMVFGPSLECVDPTESVQQRKRLFNLSISVEIRCANP